VRPSGAVNPLAVLLGAAFAAAVYWAVIFGPVYLDNMGVREAIDVGFATAHPVESNRGTDDEVRAAVLRRINEKPDPVGWHMEEDPKTGEMVEKFGLGLEPDAVTVERDPATSRIRVAVDYSRTVRYKPTQKVRVVSFHVEKEGPIP